MTDFAAFLGALMTSFAQARRIADEESAAIAEYYRDHPLLNGMAAPRLRLPEIDVEIPVVIEDVVAAKPSKPAAPKDVAAKVADSIKESGVTLPAAALKRVRDGVERKLATTGARLGGGAGMAELAAKLAEEVVLDEMGASSAFGQAARTKTLAAVRAAAVAAAVIDRGAPSALKVSALTSAVKDSGGPGRVALVRLKLTEEGLEWNVDKKPDGTVDRRLVPE